MTFLWMAMMIRPIVILEADQLKVKGVKRVQSALRAIFKLLKVIACLKMHAYPTLCIAYKLSIVQVPCGRCFSARRELGEREEELHLIFLFESSNKIDKVTKMVGRKFGATKLFRIV